MRTEAILVIEDDATIADAVAARLRSEGFTVETAADGPAGVKACRRLVPDLVVLDLMLPGFDGLEVCRLIRQDRPVPVLMLSARDSETDVLVGLGIGADDYMTKPFSQRELVARVDALLRRSRHTAAVAGEEPLNAAGVRLDPATRRVRCGDEDVHLTPTEFDLLHKLARHPGVVFSRERLLTEVWGYAEALGGRTVDQHVRALRRKLGPELVRTVHGVGYALRADVR